MSLSEFDPLEYVINRMENAARSSAPAANGYSVARRELIDRIKALRFYERHFDALEKAARSLSEYWAYGLSATHKPTKADLRKAEKLGEHLGAVLAAIDQERARNRGQKGAAQ